MEHILCRPELRMFSIAWGAPGWGAPLFSFITEQKDTLASAPSPGQSVVSVLIRHFGAVCLSDGSAAAGCARCAKLG